MQTVSTTYDGANFSTENDELDDITKAFLRIANKIFGKACVRNCFRDGFMIDWAQYYTRMRASLVKLAYKRFLRHCKFPSAARVVVDNKKRAYDVDDDEDDDGELSAMVRRSPNITKRAKPI